MQEMDRDHLIHPLTNHRELHAQGTHVIVEGDGCFLIDSEGRRLLDAIAAMWCVNIGYSRHEVVDAIHEQMKKLPYYCSCWNSTTEPTILLADRLAELAPDKLNHVFFGNSGSEGNEAALKTIRFYNKLTGQSHRKKILGRSYGYHGGTLATSSLSGIKATLEPYDLPIADFIHCPGPYRYAADTEMSEVEYGQWCIEETARIIEEEGPETIAAMFVEPVQGSGGVVIPPKGYLKPLRELCRQHSILFVADEVITAYGRLGAWFASDMWDLDPDLMNTAKALTSGYLPLSACFVSDEIAEVVLKGGLFSHVFTYSGHPAATAAALANLDILENENLVQRTRDSIGPYFLKRMHEFDDHPAVGEVRGLGLIAALELLAPDGRPAPDKPLGPKAGALYRQEGVLVRAVGSTIAYCPPLIISEAEVDLIAEATAKVLDHLWD